jgi:hypothetical protein
MEGAMHIVELHAENVKRLRVVDLKLDDKGGLVIIGGKNAQGKTSVLDVVWMALGGKDAVPDRPIRDGASKAVIRLVVGGLVVERTFTQKGTYLKVRAADGSEPRSPQAMLDELIGDLTFDPLAFARMVTKEQAATLQGIVGIDFTALDAEEARLRDERKITGRALDAARAVASAARHYPDAPADEVSVADLAAELEAANAALRARDRAAQELETQKATITRGMTALANAEASIADLEKKLVEARRLHERISGCLAADRNKGATMQVALESMAVPDPAPIQSKMASAEETNRQVRANRERVAAMGNVSGLQEEHESFSCRLDSLAEERRLMLAEASFPVAGIGFDGDVVTFKGLPLAQASESERIRVSLAVGLALNPTLRVVLIRDGAHLDSDAMKEVAAMAEAHDAQVWIERVGDADRSAIIISDGEVDHVNEA